MALYCIGDTHLSLAASVHRRQRLFRPAEQQHRHLRERFHRYRLLLPSNLPPLIKFYAVRGSDRFLRAETLKQLYVTRRRNGHWGRRRRRRSGRAAW